MRANFTEIVYTPFSLGVLVVSDISQTEIS